MNPRPGDKVMVMVDGYPVPTTVDENQVQWFDRDPMIIALVTCGALDLGRLATAVNRDHTCSERHRMEVYIGLGYAVGEFADIFRGAVLDNPLWKKKGGAQ